ncbi:uncharacterized protein [Amphiura filiformis]|uniref:uncharacterized protein n=1 Tax=Amphiura filiformis TaxID=82378 RepID=UPI003B21A16D
MIPTVSSQGVPSQLNQTSQSVNHVMSSVSQTVTCSAAPLTPNTTLQSHKSQMEHVSNVTPQQAETYSTSHIEPTETSEEHDEFAQDIAALAAWPPLQIPQSSTTTTLTSTNPQPSSALESTTCPTDIHGSSTSHAQSLPLNITCDDSTAAHGSLPLTSVTSHLTSILSDLARPITTSSETGHDVHLQDASNQYHQHAVEAAQSQNSLHLGPTDGANNLMVDPVSTASMVAGVSAEDMEGLDITIPASLAGLSVVAADFLHDEIVTGVWCVDCKKYNTAACTKHGPIVFIRDSLIESRAKQTLPKILTIKPSKIASRFVGVFATESIPVRTQFGPVLGRIVSRDDEKTLDVESPLVWKIYSEGNLSHYIDTTDEQVSNWMMFVKLARTEKDQNLVAHQQGGTVYFTSIKTIECGEELYVWYCKDYSVWQGVPIKPEDTFACHLCPMQFSKLAQLKSHNKYSHANMNPRRWKCNMCVRAFNSQSKLNVHIWVHMGVRPHRCEQCDKTFTDPSNLRQHKLIHAGVKKFTCSLCNKGFRQKAHLESHLVIHTGEKKLKCKYCDLMFARPNDVTQHMYKHTKEKEVNCTICGRAFWRNGHLKKHMKMHSGERDFQCTQCKKSFLTSYHLKRHMQICKGPKGHRKSSSSKKDSASP